MLDRAEGEDYQPGDTAKVQIRAPFPGKLLLTVEREKVFHTEVLMLDVHYKGRAVVSSGSREKSELDVFRLHENGLWATMQQDD